MDFSNPTADHCPGKQSLPRSPASATGRCLPAANTASKPRNLVPALENPRFATGRRNKLTGPTGSGKRTSTWLLPGLQWPQETLLFFGTLYDKLALAQPRASAEDVVRAYKAAEIHEVIEAESKLDQATAEHFERSINRLKGKVTMPFITHQIPRGLQVDEVMTLREDGVRKAGASNPAGNGSRNDMEGLER